MIKDYEGVIKWLRSPQFLQQQQTITNNSNKKEKEKKEKGMISVRVSWRVTLLSIPVIMVIIAVISIAPYLTDKDEHTALYKLSSNVYTKTMHSHCGGDSVLMEISLLILSPTSKMPVSVTTASAPTYFVNKMIILEDVALAEFIYLEFTRMPGESYRRRLMSLLYLCFVFER